MTKLDLPKIKIFVDDKVIVGKMEMVVLVFKRAEKKRWWEKERKTLATITVSFSKDFLVSKFSSYLGVKYFRRSLGQVCLVLYDVGVSVHI